MIIEPVEGKADTQRQGEAVDLPGQQIAQGGRPDEGQIEVGPRPDTPPPQRVAEAVAAIGQIQLLGDIDGTPQPYRRIDRKPAERFQRTAGPQLEEIVDEDDRFGEVADDVAQARADGLGDDRLIGLCHRLEEAAVDAALRLEKAAIGPFERIARGGFVRGREGIGHRAGPQHHFVRRRGLNGCKQALRDDRCLGVSDDRETERGGGGSTFADRCKRHLASELEYGRRRGHAVSSRLNRLRACGRFNGDEGNEHNGERRAGGSRNAQWPGDGAHVSAQPCRRPRSDARSAPWRRRA